tara:strand:+ start:9514 stop:12927 length:3414 start_codon:yes stop_codon:yes gene_type:complete
VERVRIKKSYFGLGLGLAALLLLSGCTKQDLNGFLGSGDSDSISELPGSDSLTIDNFIISNPSSENFQLTFDYEGDANNNAAVDAYVCSIATTPGCDPKTGTKVTFEKSSGELIAYVDLTVAPFSAGDLVKFSVEVADPDGVNGPREKSGYVIVPDSDDPRLITQLGYISTGSKNDSGNNEYINDIATDSNGNVYLAGYTAGAIGEMGAGDNDALIIKLDSDGNLDTSFGGGDGIAQLGNITIGPNANGDDRLYAIVVDSEGNVFVAGDTEGSLGEANAGSNDIFVAKLTASGNLDTSFGGGDGIAQLGNVTIGAAASSLDTGRSVALDSLGNIYVGGRTGASLGEANAGNYDILVAKFNSAGLLDTSFGGGDGIAQLGNVTIGSGASGAEILSDIFIDENDNIFIGGSTYGSLGEANAGNYDAFVAKMDSDGALITAFGGGDGITQLGNVTIGANASGSNQIYALKLDASGNIFITGRTLGDLGETSGGSYDAFLAKLDSTGALDTSFAGGDGIAQLGNTTVGGGASSFDYARDLHLDASGNILIVGETPGSMGEAVAGVNNDIYVAKFDSLGDLDTSFGGGDGILQLGNVTVGSPATGLEIGMAITGDSSGNLFTTGYTNGSLGESSGGENDAYVVKLDSDGTLVSSFGGGDGIAQLGYNTVGGGASGGNSLTNLVQDASGNTFFVGTTEGSLGEAAGGLTDIIVIKLNPYGKLDTSFGGGDGIVQLGKATIGSGADNYDYAYSIVLDASGNIFIGGSTGGSLGEANAGSNDIFVAKFDATGALDTSFGGGDGIAQLGNVTVGAAASSTDYAYSMVLDASGNIYLGGNTYGGLGETNAGGADAIVVKLNSTGALDTSFGGGDGIAHLGSVTVGAAASQQQYAKKVALDGVGNVYLTGETSGDFGEATGGGNDAFLAKLNSSGVLDATFGGGDGIVQLGDTTMGAAADNVEAVNAIFIDTSNNIYIAGESNGSLGEANSSGYDAFVAKIDSNGALVTAFGGGDGIAQLGNVTMGAAANGAEYVTAIQLDSSGNIYLAGKTDGSLGEANAGGYDAFVAKLDSSGSLDTTFGGTDGIAQLGATLVGTNASSEEFINTLYIGSGGNLFLGGGTNGSLGEANAGDYDIFISQLTPSGDAP